MMKKSVIMLLALLLFSALPLFSEEKIKNKAKPGASAKLASDKQEQMTREQCMANILTISKAVYLYNIDNSPRLTDLLNGDVCTPGGFLVRRSGMKHPIEAPDKRCFYRSHGNLASGGIVVCEYHGSNPDVPEMQLHGLAEAPIIDGQQIIFSGGIDLESPLLPRRLKLKSENAPSASEESPESRSNTSWRPRWPPAEANNHPLSLIKIISLKGKNYRAVQAPEIIPPESVEEHNQALKRQNRTNQCRIDILQLSKAIELYRADHPDKALAQLDKYDYSTFSGFLVKQGYLNAPIISDCSYKIDLRLGDNGPVYCPEHD